MTVLLKYFGTSIDQIVSSSICETAVDALLQD